METSTTLIKKISVSSQKNEFIIFLVDNDQIYCKLFKQWFRKSPEYKIYTFATGEECIKYHFVLQPDIIILEYSINNLNPIALNGLEILKRVKNSNPQIPVMMLSGQETITIAKQCIDHGAFDYIIKNETAFLQLQFLIKIIIDKIKYYQDITNKNYLTILVWKKYFLKSWLPFKYNESFLISKN